MSSDYKLVCAELIEALELADWPCKNKQKIADTIERAKDAMEDAIPREACGETWLELCQEFVDAASGDDPCRQIRAFNAILNAAAEWDAKGFPSDEELQEFAEEHWKSFAHLDGEEIAYILNTIHPVHFADFARNVLVKWRNWR